MSDFDAEWARCALWIEAALEACGGTHDLADVEALVRSREVRFWAGARSAMITELQVWPRKTVLLFWLAGGDLAELRDELRPAAEAWAAEQGATRFAVVGRAGWARSLPGYKPVATVCAKEI